MSDLFDEWEAYCKDGSNITFKNFAEAKVTELESEVSALKESVRGYKAMEDAYVQKITDLKTEIELMTTEDKL